MKLIHGDCIEQMQKLEENSIDITITSPPYNLSIAYNSYRDNLPIDQYLEWCDLWLAQVARILKKDGSFFLNIGNSCTNPWISNDVANIARKYFVLQNKIIWAKSISVGDKNFGHFKPINSKRYVNHLYEDIYHFTLDGNVKIDKLAIGVEYSDKSNLIRWQSVENDKRCRGNIWYIPYETIQKKEQKGNHPAIFPKQLVVNCLKLHGLEKIKSVLDPFCGTGTTNLICEELGIESIGIDIDETYLNYAKIK